MLLFLFRLYLPAPKRLNPLFEKSHRLSFVLAAGAFPILCLECGVHFFIDEEFERNRAATLTGLDDPQYSGVRDAYESAYRHMDSDPPDTKAAVRSMFESLEILVRQMVPAKNLYKKLVETTLKEKYLTLYLSEPTAAQVVTDDWVNALHNYRHGQPSQQPVAPTIEVAVYVLSSGSAFLRWLVGMNTDLKNAVKD